MAKLKINLDFSLKRLDLVTKGLVSTRFLGGYQSVFKGNGLEFDNYRKYIQGYDDASMIDWKASRRVNDLLIKEFVEERNIEIVFMVDVSEKMLSGSVQKLKAEYIAELVSSFCYSILKTGDSVGLLLYSDKIVKFLPSNTGFQQFYSITRDLSNVKNYGGFPNIDRAIDFAFRRVNRNAFVVLISDFIYPIRYEKNLRFAAKKFDFISMMVRDVREMTMPEGIGEVLLEDPYSGETLLINSNKIKKEYAKVTSSDVTETKKLMTSVGADFLFLQTNKPFMKPLTEFFKARENKWR